MDQKTYSGSWSTPFNEDGIITSVDVHDDYYTIHCKSSGFGLDKKHGVEPKVGDKVETYGDGFGRPIEGVRLNGVVVFQYSDEEIEENNRREAAQREADKQKKFEENKSSLDRSYDALPFDFKAKIDRLRAKKEGFRVNHEAYEIFACQEAVKIATAIRKLYPSACEAPMTKEKSDLIGDAIKKFFDLPFDEQTKLVPDMDEGHSGNTFGIACQMAHFYLVRPKVLKFIHGAMAQLTGCEGYGCHPLTPEENAEADALVKEYDFQ